MSIIYVSNIYFINVVKLIIIHEYIFSYSNNHDSNFHSTDRSWCRNMHRNCIHSYTGRNNELKQSINNNYSYYYNNIIIRLLLQAKQLDEFKLLFVFKYDLNHIVNSVIILKLLSKACLLIYLSQSNSIKCQKRRVPILTIILFISYESCVTNCLLAVIFKPQTLIKDNFLTSKEILNREKAHSY